jgi:hypothetical protein
VEAQRRLRRAVDDLRRQDHRDEREHVEVHPERSMLVDELGDGLALAPEAPVPEQGQPALGGLVSQRIGAAAFRRRVDADDVMTRF